MDTQLLDEMSSLDMDDTGDPQTVFRFLDLPSELRLKIYSLVLFPPRPKRRRRYHLARIHILLVCRRFHAEASHLLYSSLSFRVFPLQDFSPQPALGDIAPEYKPSIRSLSLVLGSSWTHPPHTWKVNERLGLHQMNHVHTLEIFVQCDPSHPIFEGFRVSKGFYTEYAGTLLKDILGTLPDLTWVLFDGNPSVEKNGDLMARLISEVRGSSKKVRWGPARGWKD